MRWNSPVLGLALLTLCASARADRTGTAAVSGPDGPGVLAAGLVTAAKVSVCAELKVLDGGPLSQALSAAAARGVHLRLILDPAQRSTRSQGRALSAAFQGLSPAAAALQCRWLAGAGRFQRRVLADRAHLLRWRLGQAPRQGDDLAEAEAERFERRWAQASASLPELQTLDDDLKALPDPRENDPRIVRRREAAGE